MTSFKTLLKRLHFRCHVGDAADAIGRVTASQDPYRMVRLRALFVPDRAERLVSHKALQAYLRCEHVLRRFSRRPGRRGEQAAARAVDSQKRRGDQ